MDSGMNGRKAPRTSPALSLLRCREPNPPEKSIPLSAQSQLSPDEVKWILNSEKRWQQQLDKSGLRAGFNTL